MVLVSVGLLTTSKWSGMLRACGSSGVRTGIASGSGLYLFIDGGITWGMNEAFCGGGIGGDLRSGFASTGSFITSNSILIPD